MADSFKHAQSSVVKFGGKPEDYISIHEWFDETKYHHHGLAHRALRHHTLGIQDCIRTFGHSVINSDGDQVSVKMLAVQHIQEDFGIGVGIKMPQVRLKQLLG